MSVTDNKAVFLSYASQDADAARRICDALRAAGVEVWFDQSELRGGDAWDQKIRRQIRECALFVPIISASTQARAEGYFRLEWKLADRRTDLIGKSKAFLLPVCIDDTRDTDADVPDSFVAVQWIRLPGGEPSDAFCARVKTLLTGEVGARTSSSATSIGRPRTPAAASESSRGRQIALAVAGLTTVVALALWQPWRKPEELKSALVKTAPAAPVSEARKLALQAKALIDDDPLAVRENYLAAERLCQRAIALDPGDWEAWAALSRAGTKLYADHQDRTADRHQRARSAAETAMRLAPESIEAGLAVANYDFRIGAGADAARARLTAMATTGPTDRRVLELLTQIEFRARRFEAGETWMTRASALPGGSALALAERARYHLARGELPDAHAWIEKSLAIQPTAEGYHQKLRLLTDGWADFEAARAVIATLPSSLRQEDNIATFAYRAELWSRNFDRAAAALESVPREFIEAYSQFYPKAYLLGEALHQGGKMRAAEIHRREALKQIEARMGVEPSSWRLLIWKGKLLARLGELPEAARCFAAAEEFGVPTSRWSKLFVPEKFVLLGQREEAVAACVELLKRTDLFWAFTLNDLRFDPIFDPLRSHPRFKQLIAEGEDWLAELKAKAAQPKVAATTTEPSGAAPAASSKSAGSEKSVAVLAFANLSDDKENEYFSDGISEELLNVLAKVPGLRVAARTSAFYFKGRNATAQEIGEKLGVAHLVEGSVRKVGAQVRIAARLINARDGTQIWADDFREELKDVFAVQDKIAGSIAKNLQLKLGGAPRKKTVNPEAHRLVLEGRNFWYQRAERTEEMLAKAVNAFERALALDEEFADAHAGLGDVWVIRALYRSMDGRGAAAADDYARATVAAKRALALDSGLAEPHVTLACVAYCERRFAEGEQHYARAFALNPNYALAYHWHSLLLVAMGRFDEALSQVDKSIRLDPLSVNTLWSATINHMIMGQLAEALLCSERTIALRPWLLPAHSQRALILLNLNRKAEAAEAAGIVTRDTTSELRWESDSDAIHVLRATGREVEATEHGRRVLASLPADDYRRAFVLVALGRFDEALPALATVPTIAIARLYWTAMWDPFRDDPRFQQLMAKLGCAEEYKVARETLARLRREPEAKR